MEYKLFSDQELNEFKETGFDQHDELSEPVVIGRYAFKLAGKKRSLLPNADDYIRWYSPFKLNEGETLDLRVANNEKIPDDKQILKIDGDTNIFMQHLLSQKNFYKEHLEKSFGQSNNQQSVNPRPANQQLITQQSVNQLSISQLSISSRSEVDQQSANPKSTADQGIKKSRPLNVDFVTLRSVLRNLMDCQYGPAKIQTIFGEYHEGTIYLDMEKKFKFSRETHDYARRKFQLKCTSNKSNVSNGTAGDRPTNASDDQKPSKKDADEFKDLLTHNLCQVFKSQIGEHTLLYAASVSSFERDPSTLQTDSSPLSTIEVRASKTSKNKIKNFNIKALRWYCNSLFTNDKKFAIACWPDDFVANEITEYSLDELLEIGGGELNKKICLYQLNAILNFIKESFAKNHNTSLLKFVLEKDPRRIVCERSNRRVRTNDSQKVWPRTVHQLPSSVMEYRLFSYQALNEFKETGFNRRHHDLSEPVVIGKYAFELVGKQRNLLPNPDDYIRWYSPLKLNEGETLDLRVTDNEKIPDETEILKTDGDTTVFVQHLLSQKNFYKAHLEKSFGQSSNQFKKFKKRRPLNVDFVTLRGILCNLMNCQYDPRKILTIFGEYHEGTIYLDMDKSYHFSEIVLHDYAKWKFHLKCTSNKPKASNGTADQATNVSDSQSEEDAEEFKDLLTHTLCQVFKSQLGEHTLLYAGSVECFERNSSTLPTDSSPVSSVEVRSSKIAKTDIKINNYKNKVLRWYCHSLFTNNKKFAIAFWPDDFVANDIREYSLDELLEIGGSEWSMEVCLYQLNAILNFIKRSFATSHNTSLLKFVLEKDPRRIVCERSNRRVLTSEFKEQLGEQSGSSSSNWRS